MDTGVYVAASTEPDYGVLAAMVVAGEAVLIGERFDADGVKQIAVEVVPEGGIVDGPGYSPNAEQGSIRIGREFFTTALRDYADWKEKWWREAVQNSVDAGATEIVCDIVQEADHGWRITVRDNGGGMSEDVLINKFLVLGGTTKVVGGSTGGFGKAKELLVLPWMQWRIHTQDTVVQGTGIDYSVDRGSYLGGTELTVWMPPDQATDEAACLAFIGKCSIPGVRFVVNGQPHRAKLAVKGEPIQDFAGKALLYYDKKGTFEQKMLIRTNGLYMFSSWVADGVEGTIIVELVGRSIDLLTANRDGFRDRELMYEVQTFTNRLAADLKSALRKKKGLVRQKFRGTGGFQAADTETLQALMLDKIARVEPSRESKRGLELSTEQIQALQEMMQKYGGTDTPEPEMGYAERRMDFEDVSSRDVADEDSRPMVMRASPELVETMLQGAVMGGAAHVEAAIKQLAWQPDFFLVNEIDGFKVPKRFWPESMSRPNRLLARFWAELCRFVLIQLGSNQTFGVGWVFDTGVGAEYIHEENENWLMLNPFHDSDPDKPPLSIADRDDVAWLYAAAVHECTHMADGISYHDESFAAAMTRNVARTSGKEKQIRRILKEVKQIEQPAPRRPRATTGGSGARRSVGPLVDRVAEALRLSKADVQTMTLGLLESDVMERYYRVEDYEERRSLSDLARELRELNERKGPYGHVPKSAAERRADLVPRLANVLDIGWSTVKGTALDDLISLVDDRYYALPAHLRMPQPSEEAKELAALESELRQLREREGNWALQD